MTPLAQLVRGVVRTKSEGPENDEDTEDEKRRRKSKDADDDSESDDDDSDDESKAARAARRRASIGAQAILAAGRRARGEVQDDRPPYVPPQTHRRALTDAERTDMARRIVDAGRRRRGEIE